MREQRAVATDLPPERLVVADRVAAGLEAVREIVGKVWKWIVARIALGAFIYGYVLAELFAQVMGRDAW